MKKPEINDPVVDSYDPYYHGKIYKISEDKKDIWVLWNNSFEELFYSYELKWNETYKRWETTDE